jgi:hypothetical protein
MKLALILEGDEIDNEAINRVVDKVTAFADTLSPTMREAFNTLMSEQGTVLECPIDYMAKKVWSSNDVNIVGSIVGVFEFEF